MLGYVCTWVSILNAPVLLWLCIVPQGGCVPRLACKLSQCNKTKGNDWLLPQDLGSNLSLLVVEFR
jgi:hypothetical protein